MVSQEKCSSINFHGEEASSWKNSAAFEGDWSEACRGESGNRVILKGGREKVTTSHMLKSLGIRLHAMRRHR